MTKQEKIREGMAMIVYNKDLDSQPAIPFNKQSDEIRGVWLEYADEILSYLHSQGVVIKTDREMPVLQKDNIKLSKFKEIIDKTIVDAGTTNPCVEFWVGNHEYELDKIGQFSVLPNVTITLKDAKAGYTAVEPLTRSEPLQSKQVQNHQSG